jgi:hypothetical protein
MSYHRKGGSYSSDLVLQNIEAKAYEVLNSFFSDNVAMKGGSLSKANTDLYQQRFAKRMKGGADTCDTVATAPPIAHPSHSFVPPFAKPEGTSHMIDVPLPEMSVQPYNQYYFPHSRA